MYLGGLTFLGLLYRAPNRGPFNGLPIKAPTSGQERYSRSTRHAPSIALIVYISMGTSFWNRFIVLDHQQM